MQYWVNAERLKYFMDLRGMTIADVEVECHTGTRHESFMKLMTEGGPTREFFLLGDIGRAIDVPTTEFVKVHQGEEGDESNDVHIFEQQKRWPLDYDESHYIDQSLGIEKLREYDLI